MMNNRETLIKPIPDDCIEALGREGELTLADTQLLTRTLLVPGAFQKLNDVTLGLLMRKLHFELTDEPSYVEILLKMKETQDYLSLNQKFPVDGKHQT